MKKIFFLFLLINFAYAGLLKNFFFRKAYNYVDLFKNDTNKKIRNPRSINNDKFKESRQLDTFATTFSENSNTTAISISNTSSIPTTSSIFITSSIPTTSSIFSTSRIPTTSSIPSTSSLPSTSNKRSTSSIPNTSGISSTSSISKQCFNTLNEWKDDYLKRLAQITRKRNGLLAFSLIDLKMHMALYSSSWEILPDSYQIYIMKQRELALIRQTQIEKECCYNNVTYFCAQINI